MMKLENPQASEVLFSTHDKAILHGAVHQVAKRHGCSSAYVHYIMHGRRNAKSVLAQRIVQDLTRMMR